MEAADGEKYLTDVANVETLLRMIQSVPSSKADPVKLRLTGGVLVFNHRKRHI